jgi:MFS family permease
VDAAVTVDDLAAVQRRTLRVLAVGQIVGSAALAAAVTVGAFVIQEILDAETAWAGIATAMVTTGTAFMSQVLSRMMQRRGRRAGLQTGYLLAALGGTIAAVGVERYSLPIFLVGLFLFGNGQASNLLARYAATDLALAPERGRAMSRIVFASTFGAVFGPLLIEPAEAAGERWFGFETYTGPWLLSAVAFAAAALNTAIRLRPDPLLVSRRQQRIAGPPPPARIGATVRSVVARPDTRLALLAMVISQVTMVAVMAMTPLHLRLHGHESVSPYVISLHIAGMFAFSPLVGRFSDGHGRYPTILCGAGLLVAATLMAALSGDVEQMLFPSLWLLGLGWNFGLIGGSSLLVDGTPVGERVAVQGTADLLMSFCGGLAGFGSGFVRKAVGFHVLAALAMVAAGVLLVAAYSAWARRGRGPRTVEPAPAGPPVGVDLEAGAAS